MATLVGPAWVVLAGAALAGATVAGCRPAPTAGPPGVSEPVAPLRPPAPARPVAAAVVPSARPPQPLAFARVRTDKRLVALTFDCCQTARPAGFDRRLVDRLIARRVPATFFLGGRWIETHPQAVKLLAAVPYFELENHSYLHPHSTRLPVARLREDLRQTQAILRREVDRPARFFRPPYGEWNATVRAEAAAAGMHLVTWSVATGDPDRRTGVPELLREFRRAAPGTIVIMHANGRGWHAAEALPQMLQWLSQHKLTPVTLADLVAAGQPVTLAPPGGRPEE